MKLADGYDPEKYKNWKWWIIDLANQTKTPMIAKLLPKESIEVRPLGPPSFRMPYMDYSYSVQNQKVNENKEIKRVYSELDPYGEEDWS